MHTPSYSFLLHLFGCNSALYYGNRRFVSICSALAYKQKNALLVICKID